MIAANKAAAAAAQVQESGFAPLESPAFTGTPTAPTPANGDISTKIATTAFLGARLGAPNGIATLDPTGLIPLAQLPFAGLTSQGVWNAATNTPTLSSGSGTNGFFYVVTVSGSTNLDGITTWNSGDWALFGGGHWTRVPFVAPPISNLPLTSLEGIVAGSFVGNTGTGAATPAAISISSIASYLAVAVGDSGSGGVKGLVPAPPPGSAGSGAFLRADMIYAVPPGPNLSAYALLNSPAFIGAPTAPTIARATASSGIATTQFVISQLAQATEMVPKVAGTASCGTSTYGSAIDHIHPTDASRAAALNAQLSGSAVLNGTLTLTGTLALTGTGVFPTPSPGDNTTKPATTAFVQQAIGTIGSNQAIANPIQWITATGTATITIPTGATRCQVTLVGAGGSVSAASNAYGGGAGATLFKLLTGLVAGSTLSLSVGAVGSGNGGNTTLSSGTQIISTLTAGGGSGINGSPGPGGTATGGDVNITGQPGMGGEAATKLAFGGSSLFGAGGVGWGASIPAAQAASGFGSGGATDSTSTMSGRSGMARFEWFP